MKRRSEGNVYRCRLKCLSAGYSLSIVGRRSMSATGATVEAVMDALRDLILVKFGDGEAILDFQRPASRGSSARDPMRVTALEYNELIAWETGDRAELWSGGVCNRCFHGKGVRTARPRQILQNPRNDIVGLIDDRNGCLVCSEMLASTILRHAPSMRLIEVQQRGGQIRRRFWEFVPESPVSFVFSKDAKLGRGWRCADCGLFFAPQISPIAKAANAYYVSESDIGRIQQNMFDWGALGISVRLLASASAVSMSSRFEDFEGVICEPVNVIRRNDIVDRSLSKLPRLVV